MDAKRTPMGGGPLVEIFIPHWGDTEYLKRAVTSVLAQHDPRWQLTIIDDATPGLAGEQTRQYFSDLAGLGDARITTLSKPVNQGITANFQSCVRLATAPLVTIMGNDDELLPSYVGDVLGAHAVFPKAAVIQPTVAVIDNQGHSVSSLVDTVKQRVLRPLGSQPIELSGDQLGASLMHGDWLYWPSLCFRREVLQTYEFRDQFDVIQDLALLMDMFFDGARLLVLPRREGNAAAFAYRRHGESASSLALLDGSRFAGEREFFRLAARLAQRRGWRRTKWAARLHLTSRAHAMTLIPRAVRAADGAALGRLCRHAFGF